MVPMTVGISFLAKPIWNLFYGASVYGSSVLSYYIFVGLISGIFTVLITTVQVLKDYKAKRITWDDYVLQFNELMESRNIKEYIQSKYGNCEYDNICLLCSEEKPVNCHRSLVANCFREILGCKVINL